MTWTSGNVWVWEAPSTLSSFEFKPLINDTTWSTGGNYKVTAATPRSVHIYPFFGAPQGRTVTLTGFYSPQLNNRRDITLYLPPSYGENPAKRYPVLYMHDGQNLFDARTAFGGVEWQVDETLDRLIGQGTVRETIVVGINNTADRISEYTPTTDPQYGGGNANTYLDFVQQTLKPYIDTHYRAFSGAPDTLMTGSSLGGLLSCYMRLDPRHRLRSSRLHVQQLLVEQRGLHPHRPGLPGQETGTILPRRRRQQRRRHRNHPLPRRTDRRRLHQRHRPPVRLRPRRCAQRVVLGTPTARSTAVPATGRSRNPHRLTRQSGGYWCFVALPDVRR